MSHGTFSSTRFNLKGRREKNNHSTSLYLVRFYFVLPRCTLLYLVRLSTSLRTRSAFSGNMTDTPCSTPRSTSDSKKPELTPFARAVNNLFASPQQFSGDSASTGTDIVSSAKILSNFRRRQSKKKQRRFTEENVRIPTPVQSPQGHPAPGYTPVQTPRLEATRLANLNTDRLMSALCKTGTPFTWSPATLGGIEPSAADLHSNVPKYALVQTPKADSGRFTHLNTDELVSALCKTGYKTGYKTGDTPFTWSPSVLDATLPVAADSNSDVPKSEVDTEPSVFKPPPARRVDPITKKRPYNRDKYNKTRRERSELRRKGLPIPHNADGGQYYQGRSRDKDGNPCKRPYNRTGKYRHHDQKRRRTFGKTAHLYEQCTNTPTPGDRPNKCPLSEKSETPTRAKRAKKAKKAKTPPNQVDNQMDIQVDSQVDSQVDGEEFTSHDVATDLDDAAMALTIAECLTDLNGEFDTMSLSKQRVVAV